MKTVLIILLLLPFQLFAQDYLSKLEEETNHCVEHHIEIFESSWDSIQSYFENYLIQSGIKKQNESIEQAYINYLDWQSKYRKMPLMRGREEFKKLLKSSRVLGKDNKVGYPIATCFPLLFKYERLLPANCAFLGIGKMLSSYSNLLEINPALLVPDLRRILNAEELKKPLYKKVIILCLFPNDVYLDEVNARQVSEENPYKNLNTEAGDETNETTQVTEKEVYTHVEYMPVFPGGEGALRKFITSNISYPKEAKEKRIAGKVYVKFCVTSKGIVQQVQIARGVDPLLDKEAIRVISLSPKWLPGNSRGQGKDVWITVPVTFSLE